MNMTQEELSSITTAVLDAIRTNSRTIDQLSPVTELAENDSLEVSGGKKVFYPVLEQQIVDAAVGLLSYDKALAQDAHNIAENAAALVAKTVPQSLYLADLDTMGTDGSMAAIMALSRSSEATRFALRLSEDDKRIVGFIDLVSDNLGHVLTQILTTHYSMEDGELKTDSHYCNTIFQYFRSYNHNIPGTPTTERNSWTAWKYLQLELVGEKGGIAPLDDSGKVPDVNLPATARSVMGFYDIVSGVTLEESPSEKSSIDSGCRVVYDKSMRRFFLSVEEMGETKYYGKWKDCTHFGKDTDSVLYGITPYSNIVYICYANGLVYKLSGLSMTEQHDPRLEEVEAKITELGIVPFDGFVKQGVNPAVLQGIRFIKGDVAIPGYFKVFGEDRPKYPLYYYNNPAQTEDGPTYEATEARSDRLFRLGNNLYSYDDANGQLEPFVSLAQVEEKISEALENLEIPEPEVPDTISSDKIAFLLCNGFYNSMLEATDYEWKAGAIYFVKEVRCFIRCTDIGGEWEYAGKEYNYLDSSADAFRAKKGLRLLMVQGNEPYKFMKVVQDPEAASDYYLPTLEGLRLDVGEEKASCLAEFTGVLRFDDIKDSIPTTDLNYIKDGNLIYVTDQSRFYRFDQSADEYVDAGDLYNETSGNSRNAREDVYYVKGTNNFEVYVKNLYGLTRKYPSVFPDELYNLALTLNDSDFENCADDIHCDFEITYSSELNAANDMGMKNNVWPVILHVETDSSAATLIDNVPVFFYRRNDGDIVSEELTFVYGETYSGRFHFIVPSDSGGHITKIIFEGRKTTSGQEVKTLRNSLKSESDLVITDQGLANAGLGGEFCLDSYLLLGDSWMCIPPELKVNAQCGALFTKLMNWFSNIQECYCGKMPSIVFHNVCSSGMSTIVLRPVNWDNRGNLIRFEPIYDRKAFSRSSCYDPYLTFNSSMTEAEFRFVPRVLDLDKILQPQFLGANAELSLFGSDNNNNPEQFSHIPYSFDLVNCETRILDLFRDAEQIMFKSQSSKEHANRPSFTLNSSFREETENATKLRLYYSPLMSDDADLMSLEIHLIYYRNYPAGEIHCYVGANSLK